MCEFDWLQMKTDGSYCSERRRFLDYWSRNSNVQSCAGTREDVRMLLDALDDAEARAERAEAQLQEIEDAEIQAKLALVFGNGDVPGHIRNEIFDRDGVHCVYCGMDASPLCIEHVIPLSAGGTHDPFNLTVSCVSCNSSKRDGPVGLFLSGLRARERMRARRGLRRW